MWVTLWVILAVAAFFAITAGIIAMAPYTAFAIVVGVILLIVTVNEKNDPE